MSHKGHAENYILPALGHMKATSVRAIEIETAAAQWKDLSAKSVNKILADITVAFEFARRKLGVKTNPMIDVERAVNQETLEEIEAQAMGAILDRGEDAPEEKAGTLRPIRSDEVYSALELKRIIDAAAPGLERALFMTAMLTRLRHGELNALRWQTVNLKAGTLYVNRSLTQLKGGAVLERPKTKNAYRHLRLAPELLSELRHWKLKCPPSPNSFIFCDELGKPMNRKANNRMLKSCCDRAGVRALSLNNLRHSFASQHLTAGTPPLEVSAMMGHSDPAVTLRVYSQWAKTEQSKAEMALAGRIFGAVEMQESTGSE